MEGMDPGKKGFRFEDPRQARIFEGLLRLVGPGPAAFFRDACRIMTEEIPYDSTSHLVGHMVREIESALREMLRPIASKSPADCQVVQQNERQKEAIREILRALEIPSDHPLAVKWIGLAGGLHPRAHRRGLLAPRKVDDEYKEFWEDTQVVLDQIIARIETRFLEFEKLMRRMLDHEVPTRDDLKILGTSIPHSLVTHHYFFTRLESPLWLAPLRKAGFFKEIPPPVQDERGIAFRSWPAGEYLARVAAAGPDVAYRALMEAPETENMQAHNNLAETAISLPANLAAEWARKEKQWIARKKCLFFGLPREVGKLISHLANGGEVDAALELAESLLTILPDPEVEKKIGEKAWYVLEPRARFDLWEYGQVLKNNIPDLVNAAEGRAFSLLCDLLDLVVRYSQRSDIKPPEDYSYVWRPAIEDHAQNLNLGLKQILVTAVRDSAQQLVTSKLASVAKLVGTLEGRGQKRRIFTRIALFLLRIFPGEAPEAVARRLTSHELFADHGFRHEYFLLVQECFGRLPVEQQSVILGWIEDGPDIESYKKWRKEESGYETTAEEAARYRGYWQLGRLKPMEPYLQREWKDLYAKLVDELGKPEHPEFSTYISGGSFGHISPETEEDLGKMNVEDLVAYLRSWQPSGDPLHNASPEGLGRQISSLVTSRPDFYSEHAQKFELDEPTYVRGYIQGLWDAVKQGSSFNWEPVLNLCKRAVDHQREIPGRKAAPFFEKDTDWGGTRTAVARLLADGFLSDKNPPPYSCRHLIWEILEVLISDPEPNPKDEQRYIGGGIEEEYAGTGMNVSGYDPVTYAMNTVRGEAMNCVIKYAMWIRKYLETQPNKDELIARGFDEMPEVRKILEAHLDVKIDPSLAIRSVYGERFPLLYHLDPRWAAENAKRIFPPESDLQDYFDAAWETYVVFNRPFNPVLEALKNEYAMVVERIGESDANSDHVGKPYGRLAEHLMTFYWWGTLKLDSPLIVRFYEKADPKLRGHAIEFIGRSFRNAEKPIPAEVTGRVKALWEARVEALEKADSEESAREELSKFGWWFVSRKFDERWSMDALASSLRVGGRTDMPNMVIEYLAELASGMTSEAMDCLYMIIRGESDDWRVLGSDEKAKEIIRIAFKSEKEDTRQQAKDLVNLLGSRGYFDFGDLLKEA
ncbi:MAG TPA: hypothetical protein VJW77_08995 [Terriglobia bacterium]|nr:hypothetical protein [Terriglobia bacterium]